MMTPLLAMMSAAGVATAAPPCIPLAPKGSDNAASAFEDHRALREALGEPLPRTPTMVMIHGRGGHLSTAEYSIVLVRQPDGAWHGTAVGRRRIWVNDAPYIPMKRREWVLDKDKAIELHAAILRTCPSDRSHASTSRPAPPPLDYIVERVDVIRPGRPPISYSASEKDERVTSLIRPPE